MNSKSSQNTYEMYKFVNFTSKIFTCEFLRLGILMRYNDDNNNNNNNNNKTIFKEEAPVIDDETAVILLFRRDTRRVCQAERSL